MNQILSATRGSRLALATGMTAALLFGCFSIHQNPNLVTGPTPVMADPQIQIKREVGTFSKLASQLKPSVVNIQVEKVMRGRARGGTMLDQFFPEEQPRQYEQRATGQGSGVVISADGYIMTNNHVVSSADKVKVTFDDGTELPARVIGTDPKTDLALVKVDATNKQLPYAQLGNSDQLEVGDWVMAIGNPFGLDHTVTVGVLSGKGRVIGAGPYDDFLQTDASINPGNSGGPLFNTDGQVIGINTAIVPNGQGIGFSIPVNLAKEIIEQLKTTGHVTRGFVGLGTQALTPTLRDALKLPKETRGALVSQVVPDGPAAHAGAQVEDVVTALNGKPVQSDRDLLTQVARLKVGSTARLQINRHGQNRELNVTIAPRPDEQASLPTAPAATTSQQEALGLDLQVLDQDLAAQLGTHDLRGVAVVGVAQGSAASRAGLQTGDVVRSVNGSKVDSMDTFVSAVQDGRQKGNLVFLVERGGATRFMTIGS